MEFKYRFRSLLGISCNLLDSNIVDVSGALFTLSLSIQYTVGLSGYTRVVYNKKQGLILILLKELFKKVYQKGTNFGIRMIHIEQFH